MLLTSADFSLAPKTCGSLVFAVSHNSVMSKERQLPLFVNVCLYSYLQTEHMRNPELLKSKKNNEVNVKVPLTHMC